MIHTFTVIYQLIPTKELISSIVSIMNLPSELIDTIFSTEFDPADTASKYRTYRPQYPGVNKIKLSRSTFTEGFWSAEDYKSRIGFEVPDGTEFRRHKKTYLPAGYRFSICLEINPYKLTHADERHTIQLFVPTPSNNTAFETAFSTMINSIFGRIGSSELSDMTYFRKWNMRRIDYSFNLFFEDNHQLEVFKKQTHKTSRYKRTKEVRMKNQKKYQQSAAEKNKSYKSICYDKKNEVDSQEYISDYERNRLIASANGILRYEIQIGYNGISGLMNRHHLVNRSADQFLNLDIAYHELLSKFKDTIGFEDFYNRQEARRIIRANYKDNMAEKLIELLQTIAQARSVATAKKNCEKGGYFIKISHKEVSAKTFDNHIKKIKSVGINPVLIADCEKITHLVNPVHQIHEAYDNYKNA